jgi:hypothetical protein
VWVVSHALGSYYDYAEHPVAYYTTREEAEAYVQYIQHLREQALTECGVEYFDARFHKPRPMTPKVEAYARAVDAGFAHDDVYSPAEVYAAAIVRVHALPYGRAF